MSAVIIPFVTVLPIEAAKYDDTNLGNEGLWVLDNAAALAARWVQLGRALGVEDPEGQEDIDLFIHDQHAQRMRQHPGFMYEQLPHGGSL